MSRRGELDQAAYWAVVQWLRAHPDGKVTDSDQAELKSLPEVAAWLAGTANPEVALVKKVDSAVTWMSQETERIERAWAVTDVAGVSKSDRLVLESVFRVGLFQQTMRVLASTRYLAVIVPYSHVTVASASKRLAERGHFTLFSGNSTIPYRRSSQDSSNVYELNPAPPMSATPVFPEPLRALEDVERTALDKYVRSAKRTKRTLPPAVAKAPPLELPMSLGELMTWNDTHL